VQPVGKGYSNWGAGFIGSHTVKALIRREYDVIVYDNLRTSSQERIPEGAVFIKGDITDLEGVRKALRNVDYVIHLAAIVSVDEARNEPYTAYNVNAKGTLNLLEESLKAGVERLVYASSCAVYGDPVEIPISETPP